MSSLSLSDSQLQDIVAKAVLDSITPETRERVIKEAVNSVLQKPTKRNSWDTEKSQFQRSFDNAVEAYVNTYAREVLQNDEAFKAGIQSLFADVAKKLFSDERRDEIVNSIADQIRHGLSRER